MTTIDHNSATAAAFVRAWFSVPEVAFRLGMLVAGQWFALWAGFGPRR